MKTALMIAPYFVPRRRVGALRPYKFAIHLKDHGWNPVVLTIKDAKNSLTEKEKSSLEGINIIEISPPFDRTVKPSGIKENKQKDQGESFSSKFSDWVDKQIPIDSWLLLFLFRYGAIKKQIKEVNPDLIWSTGDPWSGHWVGNKLSADLSKPWIADFRDPWTLSDINLRNRSAFSSKRDSLWEQKFVRNADKLIFTAKSTEKLYSDHYGLNEAKTDTIYNAFDVTLHEPAKMWEAEFDNNYLNILFFGRFRRLSPALPVIKALNSLTLSNNKVAKKIRIHSFGKMEAEDHKWLEKYNLQDQFIIHEPVVPQQSTNVLKKADLLLVSTNEERKHIIPAKLWEYLQVEKPILSIAPNPEIAEILNETGAGKQFSTDSTSEITDFLVKSLSNKEKGQPLFDHTRRPDEISRFSSKYTTKKLSEIMDELISDG